jgi:hypothetical protein
MKPFSLSVGLALSCLFGFSPQAFSAVSPSQQQKNQASTEQKDEGVVVFTPPTGWYLADSSALPPTVKLMVIGKGKHPFPPSINLATQPYKSTLKQYLKTVKAINESQGTEWKDLGTIRTEAGNASLSQVDRKTEWGEERLMHVILLKNDYIYILTASALKDEFPQFYKDFFAAMRSLRVNKDVFEMVSSPQRRSQLKSAYANLQDQWKTMLAQQSKEHSETSQNALKDAVFDGQQFQTTAWLPFKEMISQKFADMGPEWQSFILKKMENDLFDISI